MTETRHVRLDYGESLNSKKQLLSAEINLIYMNKKLKAYELLRKKEISQKNKLKISIASLKTKLDALLSTFPADQRKSDPKKIISRKQDQEEKNLSEELEDIQEKLAKLQ
jgi:hypothetical protein